MPGALFVFMEVYMESLIKGINHVGIYTPDIKATEEFYCGLLGFRRKFFRPAGEDGDSDLLLLENNGHILEFFELKDKSRDVKAEAECSLNHVALQCSDTKLMMEELRDAGIPFETETDTYVSGFGVPLHDIDIVFIHGPAGERIEIYQEIW